MSRLKIYGELDRVLRVSREVGLSPAAMMMLLLLSDSGPKRITGIAAGIGITQQAVGKMAKQLKGEDMVRITVDKMDKRAQIVTILRKGEIALKFLDKNW